MKNLIETMPLRKSAIRMLNAYLLATPETRCNPSSEALETMKAYLTDFSPPVLLILLDELDELRAHKAEVEALAVHAYEAGVKYGQTQQGTLDDATQSQLDALAPKARE